MSAHDFETVRQQRDALLNVVKALIGVGLGAVKDDDCRDNLDARHECFACRAEKMARELVALVEAAK